MSAAAALPTGAAAFLLRYVRRRPLGFGGLFALVVAAAACSVGAQYGMKLIVDAMAGADRAAADVWSPLVLFVGLIALENALWRAAGWLGCNTIVDTGVDVRLDLLDHLSGHSMQFFSEHFSGSLGNRITATAGGCGAIFGALAWTIAPPCVDFVGAVVVLLTIEQPMALALIGFVAVVALLVVCFGARGRALHQAYAEQGARANGELVDVVANVWTLKAFSARAREHARLACTFGDEAAAQRRSWHHLERTRMLHDALLWIMAGSMLLWSVSDWRRGALTAGDVVVVSALTFRILHGARELAFALVGTSQQFGAIAATLRAIGRVHAVRDPATPRAPAAVRGVLALEHVSYRYANGQRVFDDFSLVVPAGQRVGIVGPSGAGKSTLLALIQRLDDVQGGRILLDGRPIAELTQDVLRDCLAVVPQDVALFHRTVMENLRYGRADASDDEVVAAARAAFCDGFIRALPHGYDTLVGERGVRLSGGQRQRLSLARAFLKNAPVLLLDEATAALDTHSEREIQHALAQLMRGRTVLAVAHRLATISSFDRVVVLADGRIVEDGDPHALRARRGLFGSMWRLQAEGFADARIAS